MSQPYAHMRAVQCSYLPVRGAGELVFFSRFLLGRRNGVSGPRAESGSREGMRRDRRPTTTKEWAAKLGAPDAV